MRQGSIKWYAGPHDRNTRNPEGIKTCFDWDLAEFQYMYGRKRDSYSAMGFARSAVNAANLTEISSKMIDLE